MSNQSTAGPIELQEIPSEQRAELEALRRRILAGDRSDTVSWTSWQPNLAFELTSSMAEALGFPGYAARGWCAVQFGRQLLARSSPCRR
jgi:hypothetical protein